MKKVTAAIEHIKTVVFAALFVSMVILASIYIFGTQKILPGNDIVFDNLFALKTDSSNSAGVFNPNHISPAFIGVKKSGDNARAMLGNSGYISDMYAKITPFITYVFGSEGEGTALSDGDGSLLWKKCTQSDQYIYVKYHSEFPFSILYAHSNDTDDSKIYRSLSGFEADVYEFFILNEKGEDVLVSRDMSGNVFKFTIPESDHEFDYSAFDRYLSRCTEYSFLGGAPGIEEKFKYVPILNENVLVRNISASNVILEEFADTSADNFKELMRLFDFNPDKLSGYVDTEDKNMSVFVEAHGILNMSTTRFEYTAAPDGGISILGLLGYQNSTASYNIYDYLKSAEAFADTVKNIGPRSFGDEAVLGISYVGYKDETLIVEYSYFYENIPIGYGEEKVAMRFEISDDKFTKILLRPVAFSATGEAVRSFSQKMALGMYKEALMQSDAKRFYMNLAYSVPEISDEKISAWWQIIGY